MEHAPGSATDSTSKSALYVWLSFVCQMKIHIIFVLDFWYSLSFLFFSLPHPWIGSTTPVDFSFEISQSLPSSHDFDPLQLWIFHPTHGFSSTRRVTGSTSTCRVPWMGGLHGSRATYSIEDSQILD